MISFISTPFQLILHFNITTIIKATRPLTNPITNKTNTVCKNKQINLKEEKRKKKTKRRNFSTETSSSFPRLLSLPRSPPFEARRPNEAALIIAGSCTRRIRNKATRSENEELKLVRSGIRCFRYKWTVDGPVWSSRRRSPRMPDVTRSSPRTKRARQRLLATCPWRGGFRTRRATRNSPAATWSPSCPRSRCRWRTSRFKRASPFALTAWSLDNLSRKWVFC